MAEAIYYIDFDNGAGADSPGRGTTTGDPYLTTQYCIDDIIATHGKDAKTVIKCIGTETPSAALDMSVFAPSASFQVAFVSDGQASFGSHSNTSRAQIDLTLTPHVIDSTAIDNLEWHGFEILNPQTAEFCFVVDNVITLNDILIDFTGVAQPRFADPDASFVMTGCQILNCICTSGSATYLLDINSTGALVYGNCFEWNVTANNSNNAILGSSTGQIFAGNLCLLDGYAIGVRCDGDPTMVIGNEFVGPNGISNNNRGLYFQGGSGREASIVLDNHFESIATGLSITSGVDIAMIANNTYHDLTTWRSTSGISITKDENNVDLGVSGYVDRANGDYRPSARRQALGFGPRANWLAQKHTGIAAVVRSGHLLGGGLVS